MPLKLKYRILNEPDKWKNKAGHKNQQKGRGKPGGNMGVAHQKGAVHPIGLSGRTLALKRRH